MSYLPDYTRNAAPWIEAEKALVERFRPDPPRVTEADVDTALDDLKRIYWDRVDPALLAVAIRNAFDSIEFPQRGPLRLRALLDPHVARALRACEWRNQPSEPNAYNSSQADAQAYVERLAPCYASIASQRHLLQSAREQTLAFVRSNVRPWIKRAFPETPPDTIIAEWFPPGIALP